MPLASNIDEVVTLLDLIIAEQREKSSPQAFFAALYRSVTLRVRDGIRSGQFEDGPRMERLDTAFANRYFAALDDSRAGRTPPRSWQVALAAGTRANTLILQHLLLGVSAHINFDLPLAAVSVSTARSLPELRPDFLAINRILSALLDRAQATINGFSPLFDLLDRVGGRTDERIVTFSITNARDEAWHEATRLAGETPKMRDRSTLSLDRRVALLGDRIILPGGILGAVVDLIARTESTDVRAIVDAMLAVE